MKNLKSLYILSIFLIFSACNTSKKESVNSQKTTSDLVEKDTFTIAFGSCNNQLLPNPFWDDISNDQPDVWLWGGDVIYSDTEDMAYLQKNYDLQNANQEYTALKNQVEIHGTWDDHDYGMNDGGTHYPYKAESQQLFLDFLGVPKDSPRRQQEGIYFQKDYTYKNASVKIILLDTRYFRSDLVKDTITNKRYLQASGGTMLGETQWNWLEETLKESSADFNIIMSSVQFLSYEHGYESWGTMPDEVSKMEQLLISTKAKNVIFLSGDRHISEFSKKEIEGLNYPLIDFTSSGMTHSYSDFSGEENQFRSGNVVFEKSYGLLKMDLNSKLVDFQIKGDNNTILETMSLQYK